MTRKLSDLKDNPKNPRIITKEKLEMLKKSLDQFGDLGCVVFNQESGQLVGGHQRNKTFQPDIDITITQAYDPPSRTGTVAEGYFIVAGEKFKYREVKWDPYTEAAAMISANKQGGDWEVVQLSELIAELDNKEYDLDCVGYTSREVDALLYVEPSKDDIETKDDQWEGMPEFAQEDKTGFRTMQLHFYDQEGIDKFAALIKQSITPKTRTIWFPQPIIEKAADKRYGSES